MCVPIYSKVIYCRTTADGKHNLRAGRFPHFSTLCLFSYAHSLAPNPRKPSRRSNIISGGGRRGMRMKRRARKINGSPYFLIERMALEFIVSGECDKEGETMRRETTLSRSPSLPHSTSAPLYPWPLYIIIIIRPYWISCLGRNNNAARNMFCRR